MIYEERPFELQLSHNVIIIIHIELLKYQILICRYVAKVQKPWEPHPKQKNIFYQ